MIRIISVIVMVAVPLLFGLLMVPILGLIDKLREAKKSDT